MTYVIIKNTYIYSWQGGSFLTNKKVSITTWTFINYSKTVRRKPLCIVSTEICLSWCYCPLIHVCVVLCLFFVLFYIFHSTCENPNFIFLLFSQKWVVALSKSFQSVQHTYPPKINYFILSTLWLLLILFW